MPDSTTPVSQKHWLDSLPGQVALTSGIVFIYLLGYLGHPDLPGNNVKFPSQGWWGWWDQGQYRACAEAIVQGRLNASTYLYPIGYPLLGALWWRSVPQHAFLIPNLLLVIGIGLAFYRIARQFLRPVETLLFIVAFVFFYRGVLSVGLVVPFNTIPTHFCAYAVCLLLVFANPTIPRIVGASALIGFAYLCRVGDAICLLAIPAAGILIQKTWRDRITAAGLSAATIAMFVAAVGALNYSIFGSFWSSYDKILQSIGLASYPLAWKLYLLFVTGRPVFRETEPMLLNHYPWLICVIPGAFILVQRFGIRAVGLLASMAATFFLYIHYNDFWPTNVFRYQLVHYLVWTLPLLALLVYVGLRDGWKTRATRWALLSIPALFVLVAASNLIEVPLQTIDVGTTPNLQIGADRARRPDWAFFAAASDLPLITSKGKGLINKRDFHHFPRGDGVVVLFAPHVPMPLDVAPQNSGVTRVDCGQLRWHWRIYPLRTLAPVFRLFAPTKIVVVGKTADIDETGPNGEPDGQRDHVMDVHVPQFIANEIKTWHIQTHNGRARWISVPNPQGWWRIKPVSLEKGRVRLLFHETGQLSPGTSFTVEGRNSVGTTCLKATAKVP